MEENFLDGLTGRIVLPTDPVYDEARQGFNHGVQNYPLIINYCRCVEDVRNAVKWSVCHCIPPRIRSGGHNYEGYSNGNSVLVIDVSEMNSISLEEERNVVQVQGGVTNGQLYNYLGERDYPFPGGTCPTVGLSGFASGGGWGLSCRFFGLGCDSLTEIELVDYQGNIIRADESCNADLFWACRGAGGGNFGVITSMTFQLPPKTSDVTLIEIDYLRVDTQTQEDFLKAWQDWIACADIRMTLIARIYYSETDGQSMLVRGIFYGKSEEARKLLEPFLFLPNAVYNIEYISFLEAVTILGSAYPPFEKFQSVSGFAFRNYSHSELSELAALISEPADGSVFRGLSLYALGGRVRETSVHETAFFYREAHYILWLETVWEENQYASAGRNWIACRYPEFATLTTGSYINFPYYGINRFLKEYYGGHVMALEEIKLKYDPFNVFSYPQGLQPTRDSKCLPSSITEKKVKDILDVQTGNPRGFRYVTPPKD
ncbi:MAG: yvdP 1 [Anaerocolumna sp.]|jgi:hypothetical protein|nr:yvdP 1 [Anaerocolumna sp.]